MSMLYLLDRLKILVYYSDMVGKDSTKFIFTLPKTLYEQLKEEAEKQNRSMSNLLVVIIADYFKENNKESNS